MTTTTVSERETPSTAFIITMVRALGRAGRVWAGAEVAGADAAEGGAGGTGGLGGGLGEGGLAGRSEIGGRDPAQTDARRHGDGLHHVV